MRGSTLASARSTERAAEITGSRELGSGGRHPRSARRWRAVASTIAPWMSAALVGSPGVGTTIGGIAAASSSRAAALAWSGTGTHRATGSSRSSRMLGATRPADTVAAASRATAASQASESVPSAACSGAPSDCSHPAARSAGRRIDAGRIASPPGSATSTDERCPMRNGSARHAGVSNASRSAFGTAVWAPSQPHRWTVPPTQLATIAGAGPLAARGADHRSGGQRGRRLGMGSTLQRGCHGGAVIDPPIQRRAPASSRHSLRGISRSARRT